MSRNQLRAAIRSAWLGSGHCEGRSVNTPDDWCNKPTKPHSLYCRECACSVRGCPSKWVALWPMLGDLRLCSKHNTAKHRPAGADDPPDDFDIPDGMPDDDVGGW